MCSELLRLLNDKAVVGSLVFIPIASRTHKVARGQSKSEGSDTLVLRAIRGQVHNRVGLRDALNLFHQGVKEISRIQGRRRRWLLWATDGQQALGGAICWEAQVLSQVTGAWPVPRDMGLARALSAANALPPSVLRIKVSISISSACC